MISKSREIKAYIYPQIYDRLVKGDDFEKHGLSYAVNAELSRFYGIELPPTPAERMGKGGSKKGQSKNHHSLTLPSNWLELLAALIKNETWYRKDYPQFALISEKSGLVTFIKHHGAKATETLRAIWSEKGKQRRLENIYLETSKSSGYKLKFLGIEDNPIDDNS